MAVGMDTRRPLLQGHQRGCGASLVPCNIAFIHGKMASSGQLCRRRSAVYPRMAANVKASTSAGSPIWRWHGHDAVIASVFRAAAVRTLHGMISCSTARPSALAALANVQSVHCMCRHHASLLAAHSSRSWGRDAKIRNGDRIHGFTPHDHHKCQTSAPSPGGKR